MIWLAHRLGRARLERIRLAAMFAFFALAAAGVAVLLAELA